MATSLTWTIGECEPELQGQDQCVGGSRDPVYATLLGILSYVTPTKTHLTLLTHRVAKLTLKLTSDVDFSLS